MFGIYISHSPHLIKVYKGYCPKGEGSRVARVIIRVV